MSEPYPQPRHGRRHARPADPRAARGRRPLPRRPAFIAALGVTAALVTGAALDASGVFSQRMLAVHGTEQVVVTSFDGMSTSGAFPDITAGSPVTVVDTSGHVLGTGTLAASDPSSWGSQDAVYSFIVTVPAGEPRYGIEIGRNRGTEWFSEAQMRSGPSLSVSG